MIQSATGSAAIKAHHRPTRKPHAAPINAKTNNAMCTPIGHRDIALDEGRAVRPERDVVHRMEAEGCRALPQATLRWCRQLFFPTAAASRLSTTSRAIGGLFVSPARARASRGGLCTVC